MWAASLFQQKPHHFHIAGFHSTRKSTRRLSTMLQQELHHIHLPRPDGKIKRIPQLGFRFQQQLDDFHTTGLSRSRQLLFPRCTPLLQQQIEDLYRAARSGRLKPPFRVSPLLQHLLHQRQMTAFRSPHQIWDKQASITGNSLMQNRGIPRSAGAINGHGSRLIPLAEYPAQSTIPGTSRSLVPVSTHLREEQDTAKQNKE